MDSSGFSFECIRASVIIPAYNASGSLPDTLESVLSQISDADEVIIVDDGSTDDTYSVVESYLNDRVRYIYQDNSGGPASPRNTGIRSSRGEFLFLFDSDDLMLKDKVELSLKALQDNPEAGILFTNFCTIDESGELLKPDFLKNYEFSIEFFSADGDVAAPIIIDAPRACLFLARQNFIGTSSVVIPRRVFDDVGFFDESLRNGDDRDMWFRITRRFPCVYLPRVLHAYRIRGDSISKGAASKRVGSKLTVLEKQLADPINSQFERDIRHLIADNYYSLAYEAFSNGEMARARTFLNEVRRYDGVCFRFVKLFGLSLLGKNVVRLLKSARE